MVRNLVLHNWIGNIRLRPFSDRNFRVPNVDEFPAEFFDSLEEPSPLSMAKDLLADLHDLTLNEVDGEFYWRIHMWVRSLMIHMHRSGDFVPNAVHTGSDTYQQFRYLNHKIAYAWMYFETVAHVSEMYPLHVFHAMFQGLPVPMRDPISIDSLRAGDGIEIQIHAGSVTGAQVANSLSDWLNSALPPGEGIHILPVTRRTNVVIPPTSYRLMRDPQLARYIRENEGEAAWREYCEATVACDEPITPSPLEESEKLKFSQSCEWELVTEFDDQWADVSEFLRPQLPFVRIRIEGSVPPPQLIGSQFDYIVRQHNQWHKKLLQDVSRQDLAVAVRTWSVGLLLRRGMKFHDAMQLVVDETDLPWVTQAKFNMDRSRLVARVPEARDILKYRRKSPPEQNRSDSVDDWNQPIPA